MRRVTLTVFFFLAACGGGVRGPSTEVADRSAQMRAAQEVILSADGQATIAEFAKGFSQSQLDTCLAAYVDDFGGPSELRDPISKPDVKGLRNFLAQCLDASVPGDQRAVSGESMRTLGATDHVRAAPSNQ